MGSRLTRLSNLELANILPCLSKISPLRATLVCMLLACFAANKGGSGIESEFENILASSRLLKRVNLDPTLIQLAYIPKLANALEMDKDKLSEILAKKRKIGSRYLIIKKNLTLTNPIIGKLNDLKRLPHKERLEICVSKSIAAKLSLIDKALNLIKWQSVKGEQVIVNRCRKQRISGVALQQDTQRYYPKSASMAPLLGRVNAANKGGSGIESEFENVLAGTNGKTTLNFKTDHAYFNPTIESELSHGQNIELTIDTDIQFHAYAAIKKSVLKHKADSGSAIILSPNGEVLAMVNYPADDPNDRSLYNPGHNRNRVLQDKIEPGSTMKPFTMLLALDQGKITAQEDECFDVTKRMKYVKREGDYTCMTVKKILEKSHNQGTVIVSEKLSKEDTYTTWNKLGFGRPLGLIPSIENSGSLRYFDSWGLADKRTLSFGYGPMNTNLAQLARAYLVFANDGAIPPLKLIKNMPTYEQNTQVFSKKSTDKIANLLDSVASWGGSGYRASIKGYDVAGKTGTAEMIVNGSYNKDGAKRTFFTGFVPVKKPKYIMAIRLDHPKKCYNYYNPDKLNKCGGANSAAIVFSDTMKHILTSDNSIKLSLK